VTWKSSRWTHLFALSFSSVWKSCTSYFFGFGHLCVDQLLVGEKKITPPPINYFSKSGILSFLLVDSFIGKKKKRCGPQSLQKEKCANKDGKEQKEKSPMVNHLNLVSCVITYLYYFAFFLFFSHFTDTGGIGQNFPTIFTIHVAQLRTITAKSSYKHRNHTYSSFIWLNYPPTTLNESSLN
jgi:hypothetical protein